MPSLNLELVRSLFSACVLVLHRLSGRGKVSGVELEQVQPKAAGVFQVRGDKVINIVLYYSRSARSPSWA